MQRMEMRICEITFAYAHFDPKPLVLSVRAGYRGESGAGVEELWVVCAKAAVVSGIGVPCKERRQTCAEASQIMFGTVRIGEGADENADERLIRDPVDEATSCDHVHGGA